MKETNRNNNIIDDCHVCPFVYVTGIEDPYYYSPPTCNAPGVEEFEVKDHYNMETRHPKCPMVNKVLKETYEWQ